MHDLAGAYAVDALDPEETRAFEQHLRDCPACAAEVRSMRAALTELAVADAVTPPPALRAAVMAEIARTPQESPVATAVVPEPRPAPAHARKPDPVTEPETTSVRVLRPNRERRWQRWTVGLAAATGLAAAAAAVFGIRAAQLSDERNDLQAEVDSVRSVLTAPDAETVRADLAGGTATIVAAPSLGRTLIMGQSVEEPEQGTTYQAWVIDDAGAVSAGIFEPNSSGQVLIELAAPAQPGDTVGITVEPDGGSAEPTTAPILAVPIAEA